jgi:hypothetical protein
MIKQNKKASEILAFLFLLILLTNNINNSQPVFRVVVKVE